MPRPMRPLSPGLPPERAELAAALRELLGDRSLRTLSEQCQVSLSTTSRILNGSSLTDWDTMVRIVTACGGEPHAYKELWIRAESIGGRNALESANARITFLEERVTRLEQLIAITGTTEESS